MLSTGVLKPACVHACGNDCMRAWWQEWVGSDPEPRPVCIVPSPPLTHHHCLSMPSRLQGEKMPKCSLPGQIFPLATLALMG